MSRDYPGRKATSSASVKYAPIGDEDTRKFESVCEQLDRDGGSTVTREVSLARTRGVVVPGARRGQLYGSMFAFRFPLAVRVRERRVADP
jgi:hypothetical protein